MENLTFTQHEILYQGRDYQFVRAGCIGSTSTCLLKIPVKNGTASQVWDDLRHEYEICRHLGLKGILQPVSKEAGKELEAIVYRDPGGKTLPQLLEAGPLDLSQFFSISLELVEILGRLHRKKTIHKDIHGGNIIVDIDNTPPRVYLTGLGISSRFMDESAKMIMHNRPKGTLSTMSPEQTGRIKRSVDYRTDFYSLGIVMYQMLSGHLPFEDESSLELIYSHLAREPESLHLRNQNIPAMVGRLVMKLLSKDVDDRYQSSVGLLADLHQCQEEYIRAGAIADFELGGGDEAEVFIFPDKLYGREEECQRLEGAFQRISGGTIEMVLIKGVAGIGKTKLVNELRASVAHRSGYFLVGKNTPMSQGIPYASFIQAFDEGVNQVLMQPQEVIEQFRQAILHALGKNTRSITDIIPSLTTIVGELPAIPALPPEQARNRLFLTLRNFFITATSLRGRSVVFFLDDLQWADQLTFELLESLCRDVEQSKVLIIGTYREDEVEEGHPFQSFIGNIQDFGGKLQTMELKSLEREDVQDLLGVAFRASGEKTRSLSRLCLEKTGGNPFFLKRFILELIDSGSIFFDGQSSSWSWQVEKIEKRNITDNVVDLLTAKMKGFEKKGLGLEILKSAACIGSIFDLKTIGNIHNKTLKDCFEMLWPAVNARFITIIDDGVVRYLSHGDDSRVPPRLLDGKDGENIRFTFAHDRVREAAYSLLSTEEKMEMHLCIGRYWEKNRTDRCPMELLYDILWQLNRATPLFDTLEQRLGLARLNLLGGKGAQAEALFETSFEYFQQGITLVEEHGWKRAYETTRELYIKGMEAAYLSGNYEQLHSWFATLLANVSSPIDAVEGYIAIIQKETIQNNYRAAISCALEILDKLGVTFPSEPDWKDYQAELEKTELMFARFSPDEILNLPRQEDVQHLALMNIMVMMLTTTYIIDRTLHHLVVLRLVQLTLTHGISDFSALIFCTYGFILNSSTDKIDKVIRLGEIGMQLLQRYTAPNFNDRANFLYCIGIMPATKHLKGSVQGLRKVYHKFMEIGNFVHSGIILYVMEHISFLLGGPLEDHLASIGHTIEKLHKIRHRPGLLLLAPHHQMVLNMVGQSNNQTELVGDHFDERSLDWEALSNQTIIASVYYCKTLLAYHFEHYEETVKWSETLEQNEFVPNILFYSSRSSFFGVLARLALCDFHQEEERERAFAYCQKVCRELQPLADAAPENFAHMIFLIQAERARVSGEGALAEESYEKAIEQAHVNGFLFDEALANELAAKYWMGRGRHTLGRMFMQQAILCYGRWNGHVKVRTLLEKYPDAASVETTSSDQHHDPVALGEPVEDFDIMSALRASRAISKEVELDRLLRTLLQVVMENVGATRGCFLLREHDTLYFSAIADVDHPEFVSQPIDSIELKYGSWLAPLQVLNYVYHTKTVAVVEDARFDDLFSNDPYIQQRQPRSLLCCTIASKDTLLGMLYLENNLIAGAFSEDKLQALEILSAQIGISLENANLYEDKRRIEAALFDEKERLTVTLKSIGEGVITTDTLGNIVMLNRSAEELTGWQNSEAVGRPFQEIFTLFKESESYQGGDPVTRVLQSGDSIDLPANVMLVTRSGELKIIADSCAPIHDGAGNIIGAVLVFRDVTDRRRMEERLQHAQKMEAIGTLAGGIAHDFNNILSPIVGYSELLLQQLRDDERKRKGALMIYQAGVRGSELVKQILTLSRKAEHNMQPILLQDIIKEVLQLCRSMIPRSMELIEDINRDCGAVMADATQIHQVLMNLVTNATHAIESGIGQITICLDEVTREEVDSAHGSDGMRNFAMLAVIDTGCGISPALKNKIFDPYFTTKDTDKGTGLGLATSHGIVQEHNGFFEVDSVPGKGSTFRVLLPLLPDTVGKLPDIDGVAVNQRGSGKILLVDDELAIASLGESLLQSLGYTVSSCVDSVEALELFAKDSESFDLVISDMTMPKMMGDTLTKKIRMIRPDIPIVICTGYSEKIKELQSDKSFVQGVLEKPFTLETLGKVVRATLKKGSGHS